MALLRLHVILVLVWIGGEFDTIMATHGDFGKNCTFEL